MRRHDVTYLFLLVFCAFPLPADEGPIVLGVTTVAGGGPDGLPALEANLDTPGAITVDFAGNLYIASSVQQKIFKVDPAGWLTLVAGTGQIGFGGDGGPAAEAVLCSPGGVAVDASGNVFIADFCNHRIRRVDAATGIITTFAGTGARGYGGDGGPAVSAQLAYPAGLALDAAGNLYIADRENYRVRKVSADSGTMTTVVGNGSSRFNGDGLPGGATTLSSPVAVAADGLGNFYISDRGNQRVRRWDSVTGLVVTVAGNGRFGFSGDGGPATAASLASPSGLTLDSTGSLFIADSYNQRIRRVEPVTGIITTVAGNGMQGFGGDGGLSAQALLNFPGSVAVGREGDLLIADGNNHRIRLMLADTGILTTFAGNGLTSFAGDGHHAKGAVLKRPTSVVMDAAGNLFIADSQNHRVRRVDSGTGLITTLAGSGTPGFSGDGGPAAEASLNTPTGLALDAAGNLLIADRSNNVVRRVEPQDGSISTVAGNGTPGFAGDGGPATGARLSDPSGVALDGAGNLFIADRGNHRIRRVDAQSGVITTVAGNGMANYPWGDGGPATSAHLYSPWGVAVDSAGNLLIADNGSGRIRRVDAATGIIDTRLTASLPTGVAVGPTGEIFVTAGTSLLHFDLTAWRTTPLTSGGSLEGVASLPGHGALIADAAEGRIKKVETDYRPVAFPGPRQTFTCRDPTLSQVAVDGSASMDRDGDPLSYTWTGPFPEGGGTIAGLDPTVSLPLGLSLLNLQVSDGMLLSQPTSVSIEIGVRIAGLGNPLAALVPHAENPPLPGKGFRQGSVLPLRLQFLCGDTPLSDREIGAPRLNGLVKRRSSQRVPTITTVAGGGPNDISALLANLDRPTAVASDRLGNVYIAVDGSHASWQYQHRVFKLTPGGWLTVVAGDGSPYSGFSGDGGPAWRAQLGSPKGLAVDGSGNVFIADSWSNRIRRVDALAGIITTVAGAASGSCSPMDGVPAVVACLSGPNSVTVDSQGHLYIAEPGAGRVRRVDALSGIITTVAGGGPGDGLDGGFRPAGVTVDSLGNIYVADLSYRVHRLDLATGIMTVVAGNGLYGDAIEGAPATSTPLYGPSSVAVDGAGNLFFADTDSDCCGDFRISIRRVDAVTGTVTSLHMLWGPSKWWYQAYPGIAVDGSGNVLMADWSGGRALRWDALTGAISTIAGNGLSNQSAGVDMAAASAGLYRVRGAAMDGKGNLAFLSASGLHQVDAVTGILKTLPAWGESLAMSRDGILYLAHGNVVDRVNRTTGALRRVAGDGSSGSSGDGGPAVLASMVGPLSLAVDDAGNLFIADTGEGRVRRVDAVSGTITTVAGGGSDYGDGVPATSVYLNLGYWTSLALDGSGNLFILGDYDVRRVDHATGIITTVNLGSHRAGPLAADLGGDLFFGEMWSGAVYRRDAFTGAITRVAGTDNYSAPVNDGGPAPEGGLSGVMGLALDGGGNLYIADSRPGDRWRYGNDRIRMVEGLGTPVDLTRTNILPGRGRPDDFSFKYGGDGTWSFQLSTRSLSSGTYVATVEMADGIQYALEPDVLFPSSMRFFDGAFVLKSETGRETRLGGQPRPASTADPPTAIIRRR